MGKLSSILAKVIHTNAKLENDGKLAWSWLKKKMKGLFLELI